MKNQKNWFDNIELGRDNIQTIVDCLADFAERHPGITSESERYVIKELERQTGIKPRPSSQSV